MSNEKETRIVVVDAYGDDALHVRWDQLARGVVAIRAQYAESTLLDLAGIAKLREALDKAEVAWRERNPGASTAGRANEPALEDVAGCMQSMPTGKYAQLTDWVRAQPQGARLLVCLSESESRDASDIPAPSESLVYIRGHRGLFRELSSGHECTAVWLSRNVEAEFEKRIPQGVSVYWEGNRVPDVTMTSEQLEVVALAGLFGVDVEMLRGGM